MYKWNLDARRSHPKGGCEKRRGASDFVHPTREITRVMTTEDGRKMVCHCAFKVYLPIQKPANIASRTSSGVVAPSKSPKTSQISRKSSASKSSPGSSPDRSRSLCRHGPGSAAPVVGHHRRRRGSAVRRDAKRQCRYFARHSAREYSLTAGFWAGGGSKSAFVATTTTGTPAGNGSRHAAGMLTSGATQTTITCDPANCSRPAAMAAASMRSATDDG